MLASHRFPAPAACPARHSAAFQQLIQRVRSVIRAEATPQLAASASQFATLAPAAASRVGDAVAHVLSYFITRPDLLEDGQLEADPDRYRQHVLHVEPDGSFSVAALVWLPRQATPIHDHVSWCVVGVYRGSEYETRYEVRTRDGAPCLVETGRALNPAGAVAALEPPGDIHKVENAGEDLAVSLHIYGANLHALGRSIRRHYQLPLSPA